MSRFSQFFLQNLHIYPIFKIKIEELVSAMKVTEMMT